jgi:hypothetical protein
MLRFSLVPSMLLSLAAVGLVLYYAAGAWTNALSALFGGH